MKWNSHCYALVRLFFFAFHCNTKMLFMDEKMGYNIVDKINERWYQNLILIDLHITSKKYKPTALIHSVSCQSAARFQDLDLNGGRKAQRRLSIIDGMATTWRALSSPFLIHATSFVSAPLPSCQRHCFRVSATSVVSAPLQLWQRHCLRVSAIAFVSAPLHLCQRNCLRVSDTSFVSVPHHLCQWHISVWGPHALWQHFSKAPHSLYQYLILYDTATCFTSVPLSFCQGLGATFLLTAQLPL